MNRLLSLNLDRNLFPRQLSSPGSGRFIIAASYNMSDPITKIIFNRDPLPDLSIDLNISNPLDRKSLVYPGDPGDSART
jgi:hypothetical protein